MDYQKLADLLYPNVKTTVDDLLKKYPRRELKEGAEATRLAPSPTGYLHTGHLYSALIDRLVAKDGVFYIRLEDTDQKREVENAGTIACEMLRIFGIKIDEGYQGDNQKETGIYGPYIQSKRLDIYNVFAKELVKRGRAFPCFCEKTESKADVLERREQQLENSDNIKAKDACRDLTYEQIESNIKSGKTFALRLKSQGDPEKIFKFTDRIKGEREIRENDKDIILVKSNGIPPYSLAHVVDDTLMGTTTVVRGEDWYPSLASHLEIFRALDLKPPKYGHTPVICKLDDGNKRKLSKRKDPEADVRYFITNGYPTHSILEYLLTLLNSDFEPWRTQNPLKDLKEFPFSIKKIGSNNPMFDLIKLEDVSKNVISKYPAEKIYEKTMIWAQGYNPSFYNIIKNKKDFCIALFTIDREGNKPRKDIAKWSDIPSLYDYMFDELFIYKIKEYDFEQGLNKEDIINVCKEYLKTYNEEDDKQSWFNKIKDVCGKFGFCADMKEYKTNPEKYKGSVATVSGIIRVAITKRQASPDLYSICKLLGKEKVQERIEFIENDLK